MKHILSILIMTFSVLAVATPVGPMSYQGRLLDDNGIPVTGAYDFRVNIHNDPVSASLQYYEEHLNVQVDDGVYSFKVGTGTGVSGPEGWDTDLWQGNLNNLFLELEVSAYNANSYEALTPRHELTSAPHAFTATLALSLGNKTAEEFDNILEGICGASNGKWLDNIERCLGVDASIQDEDAATMASDLNYANLNLRGADVTNTLFTNAVFTKTHFEGTTLTIGNFSGADLTGATLDGVISTNVMPSMSINLTDATITNIDLNGWNLSGATVDGLSAANLLGCPSTLPVLWSCAEMKSGSGTYFMFGPGANLSSESAAAISEPGYLLLNIDDDHFVGANLTGANFKGVDLSNMNFSGTTLTSAILDFTTILSGQFDSADLSQASFRYSKITSTQFDTVTLTGNDFTKAAIVSSYFSSGGIDMNFHKSNIQSTTFNSMTNTDFSYAVLNMSTLNEDMFGTLDFTATNFKGTINSSFNTPLSATVLADGMMATLSGNFDLYFPVGMTINNLTFDTKTLESGFDSMIFNDCKFHNIDIYYPYGAITNSTFNNCQITADGYYLMISSYTSGDTMAGSVFNGGLIQAESGGYKEVKADMFMDTGDANQIKVSFTNVAIENIEFSSDWTLATNTACSGCTFTNTRWNASAVCPGGGSPVETPVASGTYQCAGWGDVQQ